MEEFNNTIVGTLDCLHLNIYVPNSANSRNLLPVLVYIYGGLFMIGFSGRYLYGPRYLVKHDIILATINYRLGPYGFMCLNTPDVPGNQGLKDQQLALKWIKNNIEAFGGDSNKITICGSSSGASSVDFHLIYSNEELFHKVIMQSGTALHPWAMLQPDTSAPLKLSKQLGFTATNTNDALKFLSSVPSNLLTAATSELGLQFRPCVEKDFGNVEKFIYDYPVNIQKPSLDNVPIMLGCNSDEALAAYESISPQDFTNLNLFYDNIDEYFNFGVEELNDMEEYVRQFYIGDEKISRKQGIIKLNSDFYFNYPVARTIQKYVDSGVKAIYYYLFAYSGKRNFLKGRLNVTARGASHADELGYLFDISYMDKNLTPEDELIIDRVTTLWGNFVKFGYVL